MLKFFVNYIVVFYIYIRESLTYLNNFNLM